MVLLFKRFKLNLVHGAYALALLAAFAFKPANDDTGLHWFAYDDQNATLGAYIGTTTEELQAEGCEDPNEDDRMCALGYDPSDVDFSNPSNPQPIIGTGQTAESVSEDQRYKPEP
ncbi:hypothetical protein ACFQRK_04270 [Parapedobacter sp. GCM10030251]|uniref:hypothetical protein n=1 Tax=Parapedobacter sp. GCM10030251 TaxID=3273419 RepID=UPI003606EFE5